MISRRFVTAFLPVVLAVPCALFAVATVQTVQDFFLPPGERVVDLIERSQRKPIPVPPYQLDVMYDRDLARTYLLDIYGPLEDETSGVESASDSSPAISAPAPVIVFYHGGSWLRGDKIMIRIVDRFLRRMRSEGWFVVSVNYTTSALRGIGGPVGQAEIALDWVTRNGAKYGWDPNRIGLYGVSSGGHVALMAASGRTDAVPAFILAECAPTDLVAMREGEAFENSSSFRFFPRFRLRTLSPISYVDRIAPPVLLFHGDADETVHVNQSIAYAEALRSAGGTVRLEVWPNGNHAFLNYNDEQWYEQETLALEWMRRRF